MKVGSQNYKYDVVEGWGELPEGMAYGKTHGIAADALGNVYVFHTGTPSIIKFSRNGKYLDAFGVQYEGGAHGFNLHVEAGTEYFYVTDVLRGKVEKLTLDGHAVLSLGFPDLPHVYDEHHEYAPTDTAVAPNGDIYVADGYGQHYIHHYSPDGVYLRSWGGEGSEAGKLKVPHGISLDLRHAEPELYVADRGNHRFQVFTLEGEHKRFIDNDMDRPCNFYYVGDTLYFADLHSRVTVFDKDDRLITHLGENQQAYKQQGWPNLPRDYFQTHKFSSPHGICVDSEGSVYVAEWIVGGRVTKLARS